MESRKTSGTFQCAKHHNNSDHKPILWGNSRFTEENTATMYLNFLNTQVIKYPKFEKWRLFKFSIAQVELVVILLRFAFPVVFIYAAVIILYIQQESSSNMRVGSSDLQARSLTYSPWICLLCDFQLAHDISEHPWSMCRLHMIVYASSGYLLILCRWPQQVIYNLVVISALLFASNRKGRKRICGCGLWAIWKRIFT